MQGLNHREQRLSQWLFDGMVGANRRTDSQDKAHRDDENGATGKTVHW
jgi:hypothetical protein